MNKSNLFKLAHLLTKATVKAGDSYQVTFGQAIKLLNRVLPKETMSEKQANWLNQIVNRIIVAVSNKIDRVNDKKTVCRMAGQDTTNFTPALNAAITSTIAKISKIKMQKHFENVKNLGNDAYSNHFVYYLDDCFKAKLAK